MKTASLHRPGEAAPADDAYVLIDRSGKALNVAIWRRKGERLPVVTVAGSRPLGYHRVSEAPAAAYAA
jgi:hypothetical protein